MTQAVLCAALLLTTTGCTMTHPRQLKPNGLRTSTISWDGLPRWEETKRQLRG